MSHLSRLGLILLLLVLLSSLAANASAQGGITVTVNFNLRLRSGPGEEYPTLITVPYLTTLPAISRSEDAEWIQVNYNGQVGWLARSYLVVNGNLADLPVAGAGGVVASVGGGLPATTLYSMNFRAGPGTEHAAITRLPLGTPLTVTGRNADGSWVYTSYNGQPGWAAAWLLDITGDVMSLPVGAGTVTAAPATACNGLALVSINNDFDTALVLQLVGPDPATLTVPAVSSRRTCLQPGTYTYQGAASGFATVSGQQTFAASPAGDCYCWDWYETNAPASCRCSANVADYTRPF